MRRFLHWRKMTWAILLWSTATAAGMLSGNVALSFIAGLLGLITLSAIWFMTRPLWRQGHGARFRRLRPVAIPFRSAAGLASPPE
jgi:hypothetical protein